MRPSAIDTIAAIATAPGSAGIGVVRVSGPAASQIARRVLGRLPAPRRATFARFRDGDEELLDEGLALWFPGPHSFTGEDVLELQGHGSPAALAQVLGAVLAAGARLAHPGEFTQRAFLNDRLDLAQAEAVADLVAAGSARAARAAVRSLSGEFSRRVDGLARSLLQARALGEALLDFPDERDVPVQVDLATPLAGLEADCRGLLAATRTGVRMTETPQVVLAGRPNAGKSSLLNALAREEAAIVTPVPGTTRDVLRLEVELEGVRLTLADTAGLRDTTDPVEEEGVRRARAAVAKADLLLYVVDSTDSAALAAASGEIDGLLGSGESSRAPVLLVTTKQDVQAPLVSGTHGRIADAAPEPPRASAILAVSARTGEGLPALRAAMLHLLGRAGTEAAGAFSARERHVQAIREALEHVIAARAAEAAGEGGELVAEELRLAQDALGAVTGRTLADDVLGEVFARFCIGK
ncbi:MAG: tRNA uridine-5-carboxymethylaminomethyl(34) synthesis GTPase MnmE [Gammaproteobacteria bacterium]